MLLLLLLLLFFNLHHVTIHQRNYSARSRSGVAGLFDRVLFFYVFRSFFLLPRACVCVCVVRNQRQVFLLAPNLISISFSLSFSVFPTLILWNLKNGLFFAVFFVFAANKPRHGNGCRPHVPKHKKETLHEDFDNKQKKIIIKSMKKKIPMERNGPRASEKMATTRRTDPQKKTKNKKKQKKNV